MPAVPTPQTSGYEPDKFNYLELLDYRRQVLDLYQKVRERAESDSPSTAHTYWRQSRDLLFGTHSQSALIKEQRSGFNGLKYYDYNPAYRFTAPVVLDPVQEAQDIGTSVGGALNFYRFGTVELPFGRLEVYWLNEYGGGVYLPFRDATGGDSTYGGGRYLLDTAKGADLGSARMGQDLILDFNFAYHPSCHYNPLWDCPLAPPANRLAARVEAGEMIYK